MRFEKKVVSNEKKDEEYFTLSASPLSLKKGKASK